MSVAFLFRSCSFRNTFWGCRRSGTLARGWPMRLTFAVGVLVLSAPRAFAQPSVNEASLTTAYTYLLGRALVVRQEQHDLAAATGVKYNTIKYNPRGSADFVNPNLDVAYLEAWIAVDDNSAAVLDIPKITGRYYTAQIIDEWGEVITNINERTFPSKPYGKFAFVSPGSKVKLPADASPVVLHSSKAKMLARVELKDDPDGAMALQRQFRLSVIGKPRISPPPALKDFSNADLAGVDIFDNVNALIASAADVSPKAAEQQQAARDVATRVQTDASTRAAVASQLQQIVVPEFKAYAVNDSAPSRNHWTGGGTVGHYGTDYRLRAAANYLGIWANVPDEVLYFIGTQDASGRTFDGGKNYVMSFPPDQLPSSVVDGYWSIILVGVPDYRVVPNALKRYNLNSYSPLKHEADGSLKIFIGPDEPSPEYLSNWLPSARGKPFSLTFRAYVPKTVVREGKWTPAPVTEVGL